MTGIVLRDIHQPPAPSWWPPAPGWWLVAIAGLMAIWLIAGEIKIRKDRARRP